MGRTAGGLALLLAAAGAAGADTDGRPQPSQPVVGLAGFRYVRWYPRFLEALGCRYSFLTPGRLRSARSLASLSAVIVVRQDDEDATGPGLSAEVAAALSEYVHGGGRLMLTYGCAPPKELLTGNFVRATRGGHLVVEDTSHATIGCYGPGDLIAYGASHYLIDDLPADCQVLCKWHQGPAAIVRAARGRGELICAAPAFALSADARGDMAALLLRILRHLVYGSADSAVGSPPEARPGPAAHFLVTERELALPALPPLRLGFGPPDAPTWTTTTTGMKTGFLADGEAMTLAPVQRSALGPWAVVSRDVRPEAPHGVVVEVPVTLAPPADGTFVSCEARWLTGNGRHDATAAPVCPYVLGEPGLHRLRFRLAVAPDAERLRVTVRLTAGGGSVRVGAPVVHRLPDLDELFRSGATLAVPASPFCFATPGRRKSLRDWFARGDAGSLGVRPEELLVPVVRAATQAVETDTMTVKGEAVPMPPREFVAYEGLRSTHVSMAMERAMRALAVGYALTGRREFGERCREYVLALSTWPEWPTARLAFGVAPAYDLAHDVFSAEERATVREALIRCVVRPQAERVWGVGLSSDHNGAVVSASAFAISTLAIGRDQPGAAACAAVAEDLLLEFMDHRWNTGAHEGPGYDGYTVSHVVPALVAFRHALGVDHTDHPYLAECMRFVSAFLSPNRKSVVGFGDVGYTCWEVPAAAMSWLRRDPLAGWYAAESRTFLRYRPFRALFWDAGAPRAETGSLPPSMAFPKQGVVALRSDRSADATLMAFLSSSCGHNHIHLSQNHFRLFRGSHELGCRPGYSSNIKGAAGRYARGSHGHNTITVDGVGQTTREGQLLTVFTSPAVDYVVGDATRAYGTGTLARFQRHILFLKPDTFLIVDDLRAASGERRFEWRYHPEYASSPAEITIGGRSVGAEEYAGSGPIVVTQDDQQATVHFLAPAGMRTWCRPCPFAERQGRELVAVTPPTQQEAIVTWLGLGPARDPAELAGSPFGLPRDIDGAMAVSDASEGAVGVRLRGAGEGGVVLSLGDTGPAWAGGVATDGRAAVCLSAEWPEGERRELWLVCGGTTVEAGGKALRASGAGSVAALRQGAGWWVWSDSRDVFPVTLPDGSARRGPDSDGPRRDEERE